MDVNDIEAPRSDQPDQLHRPPHIGSLPAQTLRRDARSFKLADQVVLPRQDVRTLDVDARAVACCGGTEQPFGSTRAETFDDPEHLHRPNATQRTLVATRTTSSCLARSRHSVVRAAAASECVPAAAQHHRYRACSPSKPTESVFADSPCVAPRSARTPTLETTPWGLEVDKPVNFRAISPFSC
jgi:hypothetical protein